MRKNLNPLERSTQGLALVLNNRIGDFEREEKLRCAKCVVWGFVVEAAIVFGVGCVLWLSRR
jgi:hypothetical protein